jgi:fructuronate reductase
VTPALGLNALSQLPAGVAQPDYDFAKLGVGILHLGLGAFHRAHQAIFTEDAIRAGGGDWGIVGTAFRHSAIPDALRTQDHLYTVETLSEIPAYRVTGVLRSSLTAATQAPQLRSRFMDPQIHIVTLTITEKGYCLDHDGDLDLSNADIAHDLVHPADPMSAIGWLALGLAERYRARATPMTVISCDNLGENGLKLKRAITAFVARTHPDALPWLHSNVSFPRSVVDCIVPASSAASKRRVTERIDAIDAAAVQREPYGQWVIEDAFAGPSPPWNRAGVEIVADVGDYARLKLHVLNSCHSALAYLGMSRGYCFVREAVADLELARFLDEMVECEIGPALSPLAVDEYWSLARRRFQNGRIDHRLSQIAEDGQQKLSQRVFPLMIANLRTGAPITRLAQVVRAWLDFKQVDHKAALDAVSMIPSSVVATPAPSPAILSGVT